MRLVSSDSLREGGALRFRVRQGGREEEAFAIRHGGKVHAYLNVCTHRSLPLDLGTGEFFSEDGTELLCRAHGARFDPGDGSCVGGICRRGSGLVRLEVTEAEGVISLHGVEHLERLP